MANLYDEQFKNRLRMHMLICDPVSADLIQRLMYFVEHSELRDWYAEQLIDKLAEKGENDPSSSQKVTQ